MYISSDNLNQCTSSKKYHPEYVFINNCARFCLKENMKCCMTLVHREHMGAQRATHKFVRKRGKSFTTILLVWGLYNGYIKPKQIV